MPRLEEFVNNAIRSGLLVPEDLAQVRNGFELEPARDAAPRLAQRLIERGKLTPYQARQILAGVTKGFLLGDYTILRRLGAGGMGKVFLAVRRSDGKRYAIKVLPPRRAMEEERALARFRKETELSRRVNHPNITRTVEVGVHDGVHFMVMDYVPGDSLFNVIRGRHGGPWRVPDAARYFMKVLDGLAAAHAVGLVHRDIKPSNLMVTPDGDARILDLGLARALEDSEPGRLTDPNVLIGTLDYASPEQLSDAASADARSDLYGLGCTIYFALSGRAPFEGGDPINKVFRHRLEEAKPLDRVARGVPSAFAAIVRKLMRKDPKDRYQSCAEVKADLARWLDADVVKAIVGADAESARAFRPPPPELDDEDLRFIDPRKGHSSATSILRELGNPEPAPAPFPKPAPAARPALIVDASAEPGLLPPRLDEPFEDSNVWLVKLVAGLCVLAAVAAVLFAWLR
jgi:serine/threonine protein kinase